MNFLSIFKCCAFFPVILGYADIPTVKIYQGLLIGRYLNSQNGRTFSAFTGVPYAEPPIRELRFMNPQSAKPWEGVLHATNPHASCPQSGIVFGDPTVQGDEDCLYLNIYTPRLPTSGSKLLPVIIFIHGGGFFVGNANFDDQDPSILMDKDIVLVVPNYRLGPLGFLSTGDDVVPGNNGLKDQSLAIEWVKHNIESFGGDPGRIVVSGHSAGATSAHYHMISPLSKDLVKGIISESGTAISPWGLAPSDEGKRNSIKLAASSGCPSQPSKTMIECLKEVDAYQLITISNTLYEWDLDPITPFKPTIESNVSGAFLPEHPVNIIKSGKSAQVPLIIGINTEDGAMKSPAIFGDPHLLEELNNDFMRIAPLSLGYYEATTNKDYISRKIKKLYFNDTEIKNSSKPALTDMYTDGLFLSPLNDVVRLHVKYTEQPVFYYAFGYRSSISFSSLFGDPTYDYGVCHGDELLHLFPPRNTFPNFQPSSKDNKISELISTLWTNFATTGDPNSATTLIHHTKWEPVTSHNLEYYLIKNDTTAEMAKNLYWERAEFWKNLPVHATTEL